MFIEQVAFIFIKKNMNLELYNLYCNLIHTYLSTQSCKGSEKKYQ